MYTTSKKSKMISQLEIQVDQNKKPRLKGIENIEGRVVVLCLTTWYFGYVFTQCSPLSPNLVMGPQFGPFMYKEDGNGPCFGLVPFGAAVGTVIASCIMDKLSRRTFLVIINLINLLVTGLLQIGDVETLYIFRFCQGIVAGLFMSLVPTYISELTPKELGSRFGVYPQVSVVLGVLVAFSMGVVFSDSFGISKSTTILPNWQYITFWRVLLGIGLVPSILQLIFIMVGYIPESPHSLIVKNRKETAREVLALFYEDSFVDQMVEDRESAIFNKRAEMQENKVTWSSKGVAIGFVLAIMQVLSGIASFVTQAGHVISFTFNETGIGLYTPVLITISQLVGTFVSIPMLKYFEWRKMTIIGGFSLAAFDGLIGMLFYLYEANGGTTTTGNTETQQQILLVTCIAIMGFMFTFGMTLGSSVWPYISFMMPAHKVTQALVLNWILAGLSIVAFSFVTATMYNPYVMMFIYCGVTFILSIVFACISINIKGLSVRKVQMQLQ